METSLATRIIERVEALRGDEIYANAVVEVVMELLDKLTTIKLLNELVGEDEKNAQLDAFMIVAIASITRDIAKRMGVPPLVAFEAADAARDVF